VFTGGESPPGFAYEYFGTGVWKNSSGWFGLNMRLDRRNSGHFRKGKQIWQKYGELGTRVGGKKNGGGGEWHVITVEKKAGKKEKILKIKNLKKFEVRRE